VAVFALDPATGSRALVQSTDATSYGSYAFDPNSGRLFFYQTAVSELVTVDLIHGTVPHVAVSFCCMDLFFWQAALAAVSIPVLSKAGLLIFLLTITVAAVVVICRLP
jgi:hypothetical protein